MDLPAVTVSSPGRWFGRIVASGMPSVSQRVFELIFTKNGRNTSEKSIFHTKWFY
jgi:hypothetical protein